MNFATTRRARAALTALALSLAATGWIAAQDGSAPETVEAVPARSVASDAPAPAGHPAGAAPLRLDELQRRSADAKAKELFAARTWQAPPAAATKPEPPPAPTAPALPFVYIGKMVYEGATTVFLAHQDRSYAVKQGDVIDGTYRVDSVKGALLTLTYLPLDAPQTMHIGDQN